MTELIQKTFEQISQFSEEQQNTLAIYLQKHLDEILQKPEKAGGNMKIEHHETKRGGELIKDLPLAYKPYRFYTLYSLALPKLSSGDIVQLHTQFEVTNDLGFNVMLAHAMMIHDKETIVSGIDKFPAGEFILPCVPAGENVTPGMHHGFRTLIGSKTLTSDGDAWASVLIYCASTAAKSGDTIEVEGGYGGLSAIVYKNAT